MRLVGFLGKLEDKIRGWLSHYPILYALYGGIGVVLFWRGVWHSVDVLAMWFIQDGRGITSIDAVPSLVDSLLSFAAGSLILLSCGLWVSSFLGNEVIISGLRGEKKLTERTETEVRTETGALAEVLEELDMIHAKLEELDAKRSKPRPKLAAPPLPPKAPEKK